MSGFSKLQFDVVRVGLCTDCGNCVAVCPSKCLTVNYDTEEPDQVEECLLHCDLCQESCPGKDIPMPELDKSTFGRERNSEEKLIGIYKHFLKSNAVDSNVRIAGASGGFVSAVLIYALENGIINAAIVAGMSEEKPWRVVPKIATKRQEVMAAAQSKLTMVPSNSILAEAVERGFDKLGFVGLPCHIHAIRKMQLYGRPAKLLNSIKFTIGLICGSNWTYRATEHVIEEVCAVPLDQVAKLEYRGGEYPGMFRVQTRDGRISAITSPERRHFSFGFQRDRCVVCYDYANELADISVGDYFAPQMKRGLEGWSAVIIRSDLGMSLVDGAERANCIRSELIEKFNFFASAGFEHKKHIALYRVIERQKHGWPTPDYHIGLLDYPRPWPRKVFLRHPHSYGGS